MDRWMQDAGIIVFSACCLVLALALSCVGGPQNGSQQGALNVAATKVDQPTNKPEIHGGEGGVKGSGNQGVVGKELIWMLLILMVWDTIRDIGREFLASRRAKALALGKRVDERLGG